MSTFFEISGASLKDCPVLPSQNRVVKVKKCGHEIDLSRLNGDIKRVWLQQRVERPCPDCEAAGDQKGWIAIQKTDKKEFAEDVDFVAEYEIRDQRSLNLVRVHAAIPSEGISEMLKKNAPKRSEEVASGGRGSLSDPLPLPEGLGLWDRIKEYAPNSLAVPIALGGVGLAAVYAINQYCSEEGQ